MIFVKRLSAAVVALFLALLIVNCGGGGAGGGFPSRQDSFTVAANQASNQLFGEIGLEISAGTYPNGANLTLKQLSQAPQMPPTANYKLAKPALELSSSDTATKDIVVSIPDNGQQYVAGIRTDTGWLPLRYTKANGKINFTLPADLGRSAGRESGQIWEWVIGLVKDNLPDTAFGIHLVAGNGSLGPGSAIIVHGLMDNYQSVKRMAEMLRGRMGWTNVYSLAYDWRLSAPDTAAYLATVLDGQKPNGKNIDIVGHSRGCIVVRYTLEKLEKTEAVKNCYLFCGPHKGADAYVSDIWFALTREWLSDTYSCAPPTPETINGPAFDELIPGNSFLNDLNTYRSTQRGNVDYFLVAAERDNLVSVDSAQANGVTLEELTGGTVARYLLPGAGHSGVKSKQADINAFFDQLGLEISPLEVWVEPNPVNAQTNGWHFTFKVRNNGSTALTVDNLTFDQFDKDGVWYGCQWFDPNTPSGQLFPYRYANWNKRLQPGEVAPWDVHFRSNYNYDPIWTIPLRFQARTVVIMAQLDQSAGSTTSLATTTVICHYDSIWPNPPRTRTRGRSPEGGGNFGQMGLAKPPR